MGVQPLGQTQGPSIQEVWYVQPLRAKLHMPAGGIPGNPGRCAHPTMCPNSFLLYRGSCVKGVIFGTCGRGSFKHTPQATRKKFPSKGT